MSTTVEFDPLRTLAQLSRMTPPQSIHEKIPPTPLGELQHWAEQQIASAEHHASTMRAEEDRLLFKDRALQYRIMAWRIVQARCAAGEAP